MIIAPLAFCTVALIVTLLPEGNDCPEVGEDITICTGSGEELGEPEDDSEGDELGDEEGELEGLCEGDELGCDA